MTTTKMDATTLALAIQGIQGSLTNIEKQVQETHDEQKTMAASMTLIRKDLDILILRFQLDKERMDKLVRFQEGFLEIMTLEDAKQLKNENRLNTEFRLQKQYTPKLVNYGVAMATLLHIVYAIFEKIFLLKK